MNFLKKVKEIGESVLFFSVLAFFGISFIVIGTLGMYGLFMLIGIKAFIAWVIVVILSMLYVVI